MLVMLSPKEVRQKGKSRSGKNVGVSKRIEILETRYWGIIVMFIFFNDLYPHHTRMAALEI